MKRRLEIEYQDASHKFFLGDDQSAIGLGMADKSNN
jgi:hypothetical protein